MTEFCRVAPFIFSIIAAVFAPSRPYWVTDLQVSLGLWVRSLELARCYPSGAKNLGVAPRFLENLYTPDYDYYYKICRDGGIYGDMEFEVSCWVSVPV